MTVGKDHEWVALMVTGAEKKKVTRLFSAHSDAFVFTGSCPKDYEAILNSQEVPGSFMTCHIPKTSREFHGCTTVCRKGTPWHRQIHHAEMHL